VRHHSNRFKSAIFTLEPSLLHGPYIGRMKRTRGAVSKERRNSGKLALQEESKSHGTGACHGANAKFSSWVLAYVFTPDRDLKKLNFNH
jgi:hypothetical protein